MVFVEEKGVVPAKYPGPKVASDPIAGGISGDRGHTLNQIQNPDIDSAFHGGKKAGGHEQGVSGKKKTRQKPGLGKNYQEENRVPTPADQVIKMIKAGKKLGQDFHSIKKEPATQSNF